ncbi:hypothetical protein [Azospirillum canadense]|uniref:hypothetical protein n=1 Tax=Azospirillum canadense TaxID=403962 RepID=UPI0022265B9D|nr:hypothetical protein [Azospirillum canadense]MCW2241864.1 hypothetical protein [Azospirillum canadense]
MTITARELALRAYADLVESIASIQQRIVLRKLLEAEFGDAALDPHPVFRPPTGALVRSPEFRRIAEVSDREDLERYTAMARELEPYLEAGDTDLAEFIASLKQRGS